LLDPPLLPPADALLLLAALLLVDPLLADSVWKWR
jgi:hypothetical protein